MNGKWTGTISPRSLSPRSSRAGSPRNSIGGSPRTSRSSSPRTLPRNKLWPGIGGSYDDVEGYIGNHQYKDVQSKLHTPTAATTNGRWLSCRSADEVERRKSGPVFSTAVRRSSVSTLDFSNATEDRSRWHDPYKDSVQSRLLNPTAAAIHGKWVKPANPDEGSEKTSPVNRRFSTSMLPGELSMIHKELPVVSRRESSPYDHVQARFHRTTLAAESSKWMGSEKSVGEDSRPGSPRFLTTFKKSDAEKTLHVEAAALSSPPKDSLYRDIASRLHETTVACEKAKYSPRMSVTSDASTTASQQPKYNTNVRRGSVLDSNLPPPAVPESHHYKFKNIESKLHSPTRAYSESAWKKKELNSPNSPNGKSRTSLSPKKVISSDSRLCRPTVSSSYNAWPRSANAPAQPVPDTGKPKLIRSKVYSNVESRLFKPTTAYMAKTAVVDTEAPVTEAFGHPIEPEYVDLVRRVGRKSHPSSSNSTPVKTKREPEEDSPPCSPVAAIADQPKFSI
eukprot:CAMPEP_0185023884 /NCGR_PEP_ID=MMETSP1103-20130426/6497_1 /TAXON_ID=36769 /ORGANISM="Paraphysomonas bandaiensis, Strain Caron Lab Isolate" /LENGTH=506 /DNA_ID=CAMNT_0027556673 /DNA_START=267 /DNA_END=1787 /DNA_ORIENTATION=-